MRNTKRCDAVKPKRPRLALHLGTAPYGVDVGETAPALEPGRGDPDAPTVRRIRAAAPPVVAPPEEAEPPSAGRYSHVFGRVSSR